LEADSFQSELLEKNGPKEQARQKRAIPPNKANDLDGKTWCRYSISVWSDIRKTPEEIALNHPAIFPEALPARLIECFTKPGALVLDPFAGVGSTLIAAARANRRAVGIEISEEYVEIARRRISQSGVNPNLVELYCADANRVTELVPKESADLVVTSPPYWDVLRQQRTADRKTPQDYSANPNNLGAIKDYQLFLQKLKHIFQRVQTVIKPGGYCCVVVMDIRKRSKFYPLHIDLTAALQDIGLTLDDIVIWDRRQEYNHFRPLGYPSVFRINKAHEFILIFKAANQAGSR
jgi:DNA modification methylase